MIARLAFFVLIAASSVCRADDLKIAEAFATKSEADLVLFLDDYRRADIESYRFGRGLNVVHAATANRENLEAIRLAFESGGDLNHQDVNGRTPLHHMIDNNLPDQARILLDLGARKDVPNEAGLTATTFCEGVLRNEPDHATCAVILAPSIKITR